MILKKECQKANRNKRFHSGSLVCEPGVLINRLPGWELITEKVLQIGMLLFIMWNVMLLLFEKIETLKETT
jgi:hypothetical protein